MPVFYRILLFASAGASLATLLIGLFLVKNIRGYLIPIFFKVVFSAAADTAGIIYFYLNKNNLFIFHFYTLLEFSALVYFYFMFYKRYVKNYYAIFAVLPAFYIVCYLEYKFNGFRNFDSFSTSIESILLTLFSLATFLVIIVKMLFQNLLETPFFYLNTGILVYFMGNITTFIFVDYVIKNDPGANFVWIIHAMLNIFFNFLICTAFWKSKTTPI